MASLFAPDWNAPLGSTPFGNWSTPGVPDPSTANWGTGLSYGAGGIPDGVTGTPAQPGALSGLAGWFGDKGNLGTVLGGLGMLGQAWTGMQQLGLAKDQLKFGKQAFQANLKNSVQSYNNSLEDLIRGRSANPNEADVQAYLAKHQLTTG